MSDIPLIIKKIKLEFDYKFDRICSKDSLSYLTSLIDYSTCKKDIKTFLLFLYLHDTLALKRRKNAYISWSNFVKLEYAYQVDYFGTGDLNHYKNTIEDHIDTRIYMYLKQNLTNCKGTNRYLKPNSWRIFNLNRIKTYIICIGRFMKLYRKIQVKVS